MNKGSSYERGLALEQKLRDLFRRRGYEVIHNIKKKGRSGVEHQIDVLAEYRCPLHISQVIIEAKSYDVPIDKDQIMKLTQIVNDLGADRGIIVTTSYFTPDAIKTAEGYNVELWDREHLTRLLGEMEIAAAGKEPVEKIAVSEHLVQPRLTVDEARRIIQDLLDRRAKGGFLGIGKIVERLEDLFIMFRPYYEAEIQVTLTEEQKTGLISKRIVRKTVTTTVSVDALTGELVTVDVEGILYQYGYLRRLDDEEIKVVRAARNFTVASLAGLGYSGHKARTVATRLAGKGVVAPYKPKQGPMIYSLNVPFPHNPLTLRSISSTYATEEKTETDAKFQTPSCEASVVIKALEHIGSK